MSKQDKPVDLRLRIRVIPTKQGNRFYYRSGLTRNDLTARYLFPPDDCFGETIEIKYGSGGSNKGSIRQVGSHAPIRCFHMERGDEYRQKLSADEYEPGDVVIISPSIWHNPAKQEVSGWFADNYWAMMTVLQNKHCREAYFDPATV